MTIETTDKPRLSKRDWLQKAMEILSAEGGARLRIANLCAGLGVTKGSFYAHFESRDDFVMQFMEFWADSFTLMVVRAINEMADASAEARLLALMQILQDEKMARYDVAVRAWASQDLTVAAGVKEVDKRRFEYIRQIFCDMGFQGADLDLRTRLFVVYHSSDMGMQLPSSNMNADEEIVLRHAFFTRR